MFKGNSIRAYNTIVYRAVKYFEKETHIHTHIQKIINALSGFHGEAITAAAAQIIFNKTLKFIIFLQDDTFNFTFTNNKDPI